MKRAKERERKTELIVPCLLALIWTVILAGSGAAQTTAFTYQGKLTEAGNPATGTYDMQFKLFDTPTVGTGTQQGATITNPSVQVTGGSFTVQLDFGAPVFDGTTRYLEIAVRPAGDPNPHTILAPRQPITSSPYAIQTINAQQLGGLPANRYVATDLIGNVGLGTSSPGTRLDVVHPATQLRFGASTADNGGYLVSTNPSQAIIAGGAKWIGFSWMARDTAASLTAHHDGVIEFATNGNPPLTVGSLFNPTERMRIDVNGNVGIGTSSPGTRLDVVHPATQLRFGASTADNGGYLTSTVPSQAIIAGGAKWSGANWIARDMVASMTAHGNGVIQFNTNGGLSVGSSFVPTERMRIDQNGDVGIGTPSPQSKLTVLTGNLSYGLTHTNGSVTVGTYIDAIGGWLGTRSPHPLHFFTNDGSALMTVATNGLVGIGTSGPTQARLHVNGNIFNGVYASSNFHAVWGESFGDNAAALRGSSSGSGGFGVHAVATGDGNSVGVYGESTSNVGYGVFAKAPARGVWGKTTAAGSGIYGDNGGSDSVGYAGYFFGRVKVTGLLEKGAGAFKIDHPLDPENKYLLHSFVESPDMMNIYNGNVTTDEQGYATITMPDWFEALNQDFRYQLTVIGQFAQAIIASKMRQNRFTIKTDKPHVEVSWQVTGIRHDAYARANRIPVEQEKSKNEAGTYLHPQAFGQPEEKGIEWVQQPESMRKLKEPCAPAQPKQQQQ